MEITITYYENNEPIERETFTDFYDAVTYCEERFNLKGKTWDYIKTNKSMSQLFDYLYDDGIDVEFRYVH